jgi:peptide/nickel transport system ATP-binding protein/oligopeptide transport system ATP-binding protein
LSSVAPEPILAVDDLHVSFVTEGGVVEAVRGVSFTLSPGEVLGVVGESGCGKSVTAMSLTGLTRTDPNARFAGSVRFRGRELLTLGERELRRVRGAEIAMVFQDPMTSLNPVHRVGSLIAETLRAHLEISRSAADARAVELLREVGIPEPERRARDYPHQFSGGMRQRVMIAMALACEPAVLIADEPTTALDVTIQAQILRLIERMRESRGAAVVLITHDLGVVARLADRVAVMYAGRIVEQGTVRDVFHRPQHPYTWGLLESIPRIDRERIDRLHSIAGQPPSLIDLGEGCAFRARCAYAHARCEETPPLEHRSGREDHLDACWLDAATKLRRGLDAAAS